MLKKLNAYSREDIPEDWSNRLLILWMEDDAFPADREYTSSAFKRITDCQDHDKIHEHDDGDAFYSFYRGGWVKVSAPDGGMVGVLVKE